MSGDPHSLKAITQIGDQTGSELYSPLQFPCIIPIYPDLLPRLVEGCVSQRPYRLITRLGSRTALVGSSILSGTAATEVF